MSQANKGKGKQRDPPPTLFLHPSPAASHVSLPGILAPPGGLGSTSTSAAGMTSSGAPPLSRTSSLLRQDVGAPPSSQPEARRPGANFLRPSGLGNLGAAFSMPHPLRQESTRTTDRTDALWAEMQATLEEVELSASGGTRVFGPDHDHKLAELRQAQIALAQAWARSEADEAIETNLSAAEAEARKLKSTVSGGKDTAGGDTGAGRTEGGSTAGGSARPGSSVAGHDADKLGAKMGEETEVDILLARKRREANDRYFSRVNQGVLDVVAKLEEVAVAMRAVEQESKDIWGDNESVPSSVKT
ncbi:uncharacterized protein E0L32_010475 [Thyridium curvatum]|uniref:Uncharacterized protein n=1 Tax=Thyridium curvatum TaxID=1093900 RepID=A0A507ASD3_9PEZI|nr:uncharacterized protein E0L32_010475 [Thyridium curvatum]TPX07788.1 hypothetical protein E0L32_010475 [Thyridium curvatum]